MPETTSAVYHRDVVGQGFQSGHDQSIFFQFRRDGTIERKVIRWNPTQWGDAEVYNGPPQALDAGWGFWPQGWIIRPHTEPEPEYQPEHIS